MKKDRNSFFQEYGMNAYNTTTPMMQGFPNQYGVPQQVQSNSSFYAGPMMNNANTGMNDNYVNDYDSRISKLERQINRLDARISKLEGEIPTNYTKTTESDYNYSNSSMYMV